MKITTDLCVIGAGPSGRQMAALGGMLGLSTHLIGPKENQKLSIPLFFDALKRRMVSQDIPPFAQLWESAHQEIELEPDFYPDAQLNALNITRLYETASFKDCKIHAGYHEIHAHHIVLATGATSIYPTDWPATHPTLITPDMLPFLTQCPSHLLIMGEDIERFEWAYMFRRLGAQVSIIDKGPITISDEPEFNTPLTRAFSEQGIEFYAYQPVERVEFSDTMGVSVHLTQGTPITGSHLLYFPKKQPNLDLLETGLKSRSYHLLGSVKTPGVFAACPSLRLQSAKSILKSLFIPWHSQKYVNPIVPLQMRAEPEFISIGLSEEEAKHRYSNIKIWRSFLNKNNQPSHIKAVTNKRGKILGVSIMGIGIHDLILPWQIMMSNAIPIRHWCKIPLPYPSQTNAFLAMAQNPSRAVFQSALFKRLLIVLKWMNRLIRK